jgi:hypothetical protein
LASKVISNFPDNTLAANTLIRLIKDPHYSGSFEDKEEFDYAYEGDICSALCKMNSVEFVPSLYNSILRGSRQRTTALKTLLNYESKEKVIDFFAKHLNDKADWRSFTDYAKNSKWVLEQFELDQNQQEVFFQLTN